MEVIKYLFLLLLFFVIILIGWFFIFGKVIDKTFADKEFYQVLIVDTQISKIIQDYIIREKILNELPEDWSDFFKDQIDFAMYQSLDTDFIKKQSSLIIDDIFSMELVERNQLTTVIDLKEVNLAFKNNLIEILESIDNDDPRLPYKAKDIIANIDQLIESFGLPNSIVLNETEFAENIIVNNREFFTVIFLIQKNFKMIAYSLLGFLFLMVYLISGSLKNGFIWYGSSIFSSGGIFYLMSKGFVSEINHSYDQVFNNLDRLLFSSFVRDRIFEVMLQISLYFTIVGLLFIFLGIILSVKNRE